MEGDDSLVQLEGWTEAENKCYLPADLLVPQCNFLIGSGSPSSVHSEAMCFYNHNLLSDL